MLRKVNSMSQCVSIVLPHFGFRGRKFLTLLLALARFSIFSANWDNEIEYATAPKDQQIDCGSAK